MRLRDAWQIEERLPEGATLDDLEAELRRRPVTPAAAVLFALRRALSPVLDRGSEGFVPLYVEPDERLYRIENSTVTALLHVSLVDRRPRLAVYVRPHGLFGRAYLVVIEPFRRFVVYPALLRRASAATRLLAEQRAGDARDATEVGPAATAGDREPGWGPRLERPCQGSDPKPRPERTNSPHG